VRLWRADTGTPLRILNGHTGNVYSVAYSPDGTQLATAGQDRTARIWNAGTGALIRTITHTEEVYAVAYSSDGAQLATAGADNLVRTWHA
jgi:WD40 repeat protein